MRNAQQRNQRVHELIDEKGPNPAAYSPDEIELLRAYNGSGQRFDVAGSDPAGLYEFYTPVWLGSRMWELAYHYGFDRSTGKVLEPSAGNGAILGAGNAAELGDRLTAMEINPYTNAILRIFFPDAVVYEHTMPFETLFLEPRRNRYNKRLTGKLTWEPSYPFDLVIGNPPYGKHYGEKAYYFRKGKNGFKGIQVEYFFLEYGMKLLKPGGLLIFLTSTSLLRTAVNYQRFKAESLIHLGELIDCYRAPSHTYERTQSPAEIEVWRRK